MASARLRTRGNQKTKELPSDLRIPNPTTVRAMRAAPMRYSEIWESDSLPLYAAPPRSSDAAVGAATPRMLGAGATSGTLSPSPGARNKFDSMPCWRVYKSQ